ncbi:MAG: hypothetical protein M3179_12880 [Actinomycetota bacterium]|nr:hypothetical protein [Actinomycetota bacterium]
MGKRRRAACLLGVVTLLAACQSSSTGAPLPPGPPVVTITVREYTFEYNPEVPGGRVVFRLVNAGRIAHQPGLRLIPDEIPPISEHFRNRAAGGQPAIVAPYAGVPARQPGQTGTFAVDLESGQRYAFICFARDADDDEPHAFQGMATEFRPQADPNAAATTGPGPGPAPSEPLPPPPPG